MIAYTPTPDGPRGEFHDTYDRECIIRASGAPLHLWLGTVDAPMHLNQTMARELSGALERFVGRGDLG